MTTTMKNLYILFLGALVIFMASCNNNTAPAEQVDALNVDSIHAQATKFFAVLPSSAENIENPMTEEKIALGKALYFDNRLSLDQTQSCNTCHNVETYGVDNEPTSKGDNGGLGTRNSPTSFNAALHISQFWDGRNKDVEEQAGGPILNPVEMAIPDEAFILKRLKEVPEYKTMFAAAYPDQADPMTYKNLTWAIGAFERTLLTPSAFDEFLAGNKEALTNEEIKGLKTFVDVGCTTCHSGALLGGNMLMKFGLSVNYWELTNSTTIDSGRFAETRQASDMFVFKVPSLRNIEKTYPFFHDGSVADLNDAIQIMAKTSLNKELSTDEVSEIATFLKTLTGKVPASALPEPTPEVAPAS
jgi:cytochrome c peroxidase